MTAKVDRRLLPRPKRLDRRVGTGAELVRELNRRRAALKLSLSATAELIGCSATAVKCLACGKTTPTISHIEDYAQALGLRVVVNLVEAAP